MSPITKSGRCAVLAFSIMLLATGCSDPKSDIFDVDTGKHKVAWLPKLHATAASSGTTTAGNAIPSTVLCIECHGTDLRGGISGVSCTSCHLGGPTSIHPTSWFPIVLMHGPSLSTGMTTTTQCASQYCHGPALAGVQDSGPSCNKCHTVPFTANSVVCGSCHAVPPNGSRYPNVAGRHAVHTASTGTVGAICGPCHAGSDGISGAIRHYDAVIDVAFFPAYNAQTGGPAQYHTVNMTCTGVSCHGGQTTPSWYTGSINVDAQCTICHQFNAAQYNSFSSGEHDKHVNGEGFACTECHNTTLLAAVHFDDMDTPSMDQAALTISRAGLVYTGTPGSPATGNCTVVCHGKNHNPETW